MRTPVSAPMNARMVPHGFSAVATASIIGLPLRGGLGPLQDHSFDLPGPGAGVAVDDVPGAVDAGVATVGLDEGPVLRGVSGDAVLRRVRRGKVRVLLP